MSKLFPLKLKQKETIALFFILALGALAFYFASRINADFFINETKILLDKNPYLAVVILGLIEGSLLINWYLPASSGITVTGIVYSNNIPLLSILTAILSLTFFFVYIIEYFIGKFGLHRFLYRFGLKKPIEIASDKLNRHGPAIIFSTFFHPNIGALMSVSAGIAEMDFKKFALYALVATFAWNFFWALMVALIGPVFLGPVGRYILITIVLMWAVYGLIKKSRNPSSQK